MAQLRFRHRLPLCTFCAAFASATRGQTPAGTLAAHGWPMQETKTGEIEGALGVAQTKQRIEQSLQLAGETSRGLAEELPRKATPALLVAVVVGGAVLAGAAFAVARRQPRSHWRTSSRPSTTGIVARAVGAWLLRAAVLRLTETLVAKLRDSTPPVRAAQSELS
jgi:hypothetical protein